jgi:hypothetical protein
LDGDEDEDEEDTNRDDFEHATHGIGRTEGLLHGTPPSPRNTDFLYIFERQCMKIRDGQMLMTM